MPDRGNALAREALSEHGQSALGFRPRGLILDDVPMLDENSVYYAENVDDDPRKLLEAQARKPAVHHHIIACGRDRSVLVSERFRQRCDQTAQTVSARRNVCAVLVAEVVATEMSKGATKMVRMLQRAAPKAEARLEKEINHYLSQGHRSDIESGCPVAGFSGDTPRLSVEARSQFALGLDDLISILAGLIAEAPSNPGKPDRRTLREQAISLCSQMVGALVLSRAVAEPAPALADEVLESSRRNLLAHFRKS
jgi:hypothetical protein